MPHSTKPADVGVVSMDRASAAGRKSFAGAGYRLAAGGLGRRWTLPGESVEEPCIEDEFVAQTARAWTRLRGVAAQLPDAARAGVSVASLQVRSVPMAAVFQATAVCALAAIGASTALYWQKSRTAQVDHDIGHVVGEMAQTKAQTGRLRAQWLALNDPARLQDAAAHYSRLQPLAPTQFVDAGKLSDHLPAPGSVPADDSADATPETAVAGDAKPIFKPVEAQAASLIMPATPVQSGMPATAAEPRPHTPVAQAAAATEQASADAEDTHTSSAASVAAKPAAATRAPTHSGPAMPAQNDVWDVPAVAPPRTHAPAVMRLAAGAPRLPTAPVHTPSLAVIRAATAAVRTAPYVVHAEPKPHAPPRMLMARFDMPRWLLETHAQRPPMMVMSAPPHALSVPRDTSVLQPGARHGGEPALAVKSEEHASEPAATEPEETEPSPAPVYRRPAYHQYYGYGYGRAFGYPYQQAPAGYYRTPYGGYASQPYGYPYAPTQGFGGPYYQ